MFTYNSYANIPFLNVLPIGMTNFGGDTQVFTLPNYATSNIGLCFNQLGQQQLLSGGSNNLGFNVPMTTLPNINDYVNGLVAPVMNNLASQRINTCMSNINMTKQKLNSMLQKDGITEDEKKAINEKLDELKAQEDKLKELSEKTDITPADAYKEAGEIEDAVRKIIADVNKIGAGEKVEASEDDTGKDKVESDKETEDKDKTEKDKTEKDKTVKAKTETDKTEKQGSSKLNLSSDVKANIEIFFDAIDGPGTKNAELEAVISSIDTDNVMEYMVGWNKYHSTQNGESFMEAFVWDANHTQKKNGCRQIEYALREKAEELGVYDECRADFAAIDKELGSWFWISNDISKNFDNIIKIIAKKMGGDYAKYAEPQKS